MDISLCTEVISLGVKILVFCPEHPKCDQNLQCPLLMRRPTSIPISHLYGRAPLPAPWMIGRVLIPASANLSSCKDKSGTFFLFWWRNYCAWQAPLDSYSKKDKIEAPVE